MSDNSLRILFVDDDADTRSVMLMALPRMGHVVKAVADVSEAIAICDAEPFDLLISDIGMPDHSGLELIRTLRKKLPIPAIALSGYGMPLDIEDARRAGFNEHLVKPIALEALKQAIARVASTQSPTSPTPDPIRPTTPRIPSPPPREMTPLEKLASRLALLKQSELRIQACIREVNLEIKASILAGAT